jgi:hypothetical protein
LAWPLREVWRDDAPDILHWQSQPLGHVDLLVTFGIEGNFWTETITFDIMDIDLPYNVVIGYSMIAKFMVIPHYAYLIFNMSGPNGVITINAGRKSVVPCAKAILALILSSTSSPAVARGLRPRSLVQVWGPKLLVGFDPAIEPSTSVTS